MKKFGVIGLGFIYNRHLEAIEENNGRIVVGCDIDKEKKDKLLDGTDFVEKYWEVKDIDYVSILTPNYLHKNMAEHFAQEGITVLVEKPPVISTLELRELAKYDNIYTVLQLRHHPELLKWKKKITQGKQYEVEMRILVHRDEWYFKTWKADESRSGGLLFNIGIHYFDALCFLFGKPLKATTTELNEKQAAGLIQFKNADVDWELSIWAPMDNQQRILKIDSEQLNLSKYFENLHIKVYKEFLNGRGVNIKECETTIKLIEDLKNGKRDLQ